MINLQRRLVAAFALAVLGLAGCSGGPPTGWVIGTVSVEGKPLAGGSIAFIGIDGRPIAAEIGANGSYRADDVPVGDTIVVVNVPPPSDAARHKIIKEQPTLPPPPLPPAPFAAKYSDMATTELRFAVKQGENKFDADLKK